MTSVAMIKNTRKGPIYQLFTERNKQPVVVHSDFVTPAKQEYKWDMCNIKVHRPKFIISPQQNEDYIKALRTKEGAKIVNDLRNKKTDEIINDALKIKKEQLKKSLRKESYINSKWVKILNLLIEEPLEGPNLLPHRVISLTKEEIVQAFIEHDLIY